MDPGEPASLPWPAKEIDMLCGDPQGPFTDGEPIAEASSPLCIGMSGWA